MPYSIHDTHPDGTINAWVRVQADFFILMSRETATRIACDLTRTSANMGNNILYRAFPVPCAGEWLV